jgi:hypothetical protein
VILQGNHGACDEQGRPLTVHEISSPLLHIPVQSRIQFAFKLVNGHNRLLVDQAKFSLGLGRHWVSLARRMADEGLSDEALRRIALNYGIGADNPVVMSSLKFDFKYVVSKYEESRRYLEAQALGLLGTKDCPDGLPIRIEDDTGRTVWNYTTVSPFAGQSIR